MYLHSWLPLTSCLATSNQQSVFFWLCFVSTEHVYLWLFSHTVRLLLAINGKVVQTYKTFVSYPVGIESKFITTFAPDFVGWVKFIFNINIYFLVMFRENRQKALFSIWKFLFCYCSIKILEQYLTHIWQHRTFLWITHPFFWHKVIVPW